MIVFTQYVKRVPIGDEEENPCEGCCFEIIGRCALQNVDPNKLDCTYETRFELVSSAVQTSDDE